MLISHSKRFIFVHVYKAAGSSLRRSLAKYETLGVRTKRAVARMATRVGLLESGREYTAGVFNYRGAKTHLSAAAIRDLVTPEVFDQYFTFAFVRNPWDWQVSLYHYALRTPRHHQHKLAKSFKSFDEYLDWRVNEDFHTQKERLCNAKGEIIVDFIGKTEDIEVDFGKICDKLGIESRLPHVNRTQHKPYTEYYTDSTRALIEKHFIEDIDTFGYSFGK